MSSDSIIQYIRVYDSPPNATGSTRQPYSKPQLGTVNLKNQEVLGIGCKSGSNGPTGTCSVCSNTGS
jgi:hypothetical protein